MHSNVEVTRGATCSSAARQGDAGAREPWLQEPPGRMRKAHWLQGSGLEHKSKRGTRAGHARAMPSWPLTTGQLATHQERLKRTEGWREAKGAGRGEDLISCVASRSRAAQCHVVRCGAGQCSRVRGVGEGEKREGGQTFGMSKRYEKTCRHWKDRTRCHKGRSRLGRADQL